MFVVFVFFFFFQAEDGIRDGTVTGVQTCALPIWLPAELVHQLAGVRVERGVARQAVRAGRQSGADRGERGGGGGGEARRSEERRVGKECRSRGVAYH